MCSEPLGDYFAFGGRNPEFEFNCTALWRGYIGTWEIVGDRLYIVGLSGTLKDGTEATLETVFPGYPDRVFAHWYSGTLRIPEGPCIRSIRTWHERIQPWSDHSYGRCRRRCSRSDARAGAFRLGRRLTSA